MSPSPKALSFLAAFLRILLGGIFIAAAAIKIIEGPEVFAFHMEFYDLFPDFFLLPFATIFPWLEIVLGVALVVGFRTRRSAEITALLLASFIALFAITLFRGIDLENCACFGSGGPHFTTLQGILFDGVLLAAAWFVRRENP